MPSSSQNRTDVEHRVGDGGVVVVEVGWCE
jgi:hypothetical protein